MRKSVSVATLALLAVVTACTVSCTTQKAAEYQYEVMNPWADVDPFTPRGVSPRLDNLDGKKIGLFANSKRSALPQARMLEKKLKEKNPTIQTDIYHAPDPNYIAHDSPEWGKYSTWIKSLDAVVLMVGD
jgi:hypothetical protein